MSKINDIRFIAFFTLLLIQTSVVLAAPAAELALSDSERQWLDSYPTVSFTGDPNWLPYEAFDSSGQYIGIVSEHLKLISKTTGIRFKMNPSKTWTEV